MDALIAITIVAAILLAFGIGSNDETFSSVVGAGTLSVRKAALVGGVLAIFGTIFLSGNVGKTIGTGLLVGELQQNYDVFMLLAVVLATTIVLVVGSTLGLPLSTTHIVVAAVIGIAIIYSSRSGVFFTAYLNPDTFIEVVLSWIISPIIGYLGAWGTYSLMRKYVYARIKGLDDVDYTERYASYALLGTIIITQLSRGGNDAAKATGILYWLAAGQGITNLELELFVVIAAFAVGSGLFILGRRLLKNVGTSVVFLQPTSAFSLQVFVAITLLICTIWGLPISGTQVLIFAMLGIRRAQELQMEKQQRKALYRMVIGWLATFPIGAALSAGIYSLLLFLF